MKTPQPTSKKTLVFAWPSTLDPTRLQDVRGLAADGSSETQGLLKMIFFWVCSGRALFLCQRKRPPSLTESDSTKSLHLESQVFFWAGGWL